MFVILEGQGRFRFGDATYEVRAGDVLGAPRGRAEFAHKLMAVSDFGTEAEGFHFIGRANTACGYWDDEPDSAD